MYLLIHLEQNCMAVHDILALLLTHHQCTHFSLCITSFFKIQLKTLSMTLRGVTYIGIGTRKSESGASLSTVNPNTDGKITSKHFYQRCET